MAMGKRQTERQQELWIAAPDLPTPAAELFYRKLNQVLAERGFDPFVEGLCQKFYRESLGRDSIPPGCTSGCSCWATLKASTRSVASPGGAATGPRPTGDGGSAYGRIE